MIAKDNAGDKFQCDHTIPNVDLSQEKGGVNGNFLQQSGTESDLSNHISAQWP